MLREVYILILSRSSLLFSVSLHLFALENETGLLCYLEIVAFLSGGLPQAACVVEVCISFHTPVTELVLLVTFRISEREIKIHVFNTCMSVLKF